MYRTIFCLFLFFTLSCTKITESDIPYAKVRIKLDLHYRDKELVGLLHHKEFQSARYSGEYTGFAGILVICGYNNRYYAYDRCCPVESSKNITIIPDDTGQATCPVCNTIYEIGNGSGIPIKGPSVYALRKYRIMENGHELTVTN
ncbi:MAG: hypothetical protein PARBA_02141 [Parabacteroides sp.]